MDGGLLLQAGRTAEFTIEGEPRGKERPRARVVSPPRGKPFAQIYTPSSSTAYETAVFRASQGVRKRVGLIEGPVRVLILIGMPIPKSYTKTRQRQIRAGLEAHTKKPDIDNIVKAILDGLVRSSGQGDLREHVGLLKDDTQVVDLRVIKDYTDVPRVSVRVTELIVPETAAALSNEV
jgi:Holliday junction resolvase RusA-like endonuclease